MSLKTIRAKVIARTGNTAVDLSYTNRLINDASEEIYRTDDLVGATKELLLAIPATDTKLLALPAYVQEIRGIRWYDSGFTIRQNTIHARFQNDGNGIKLLNWRDLGMSPLQLQIANASTIVFSIPLVDTASVMLSVVGSTPNSSRVEETLTIPAGSLEVETAGNFDQIFSITKTASSLYDITATDADGNVLTLIPNNELSPKYKIIQIRDDRIVGQIEDCGVEILYKDKFVPMVSDNDQFLDGRYDDAIYWKFLEHWYSTQEGKEEDSILARAKCDEIMQQIAQDSTVAKDKYIQYGPNPFYNLFGSSYTRY